jgi:hypothetical protein
LAGQDPDVQEAGVHWGAISNAPKHVMLQNAIHPLEELHTIKTQADQHKTQSGTDLTYEQYMHLLVSAATNYEKQFLPKGCQCQSSPHRAVFAHNFDVHTDGDILEAIDGAYDMTWVWKHSMRTRRITLPSTVVQRPI